MQGRIVAAFVTGVMCCALFMGAAVGAFYALSDDAQAHYGGTWQTQEFITEAKPSESDSFYAYEWFAEWVASMSADCDIEAVHEGDFTRLIAYYRCPAA